MSGAGALRRLELALAMLGASAVLIALIVAVDVVRFHLPELVSGHRAFDHHDVALAALALVDGLVLWRAVPSLWRQTRAQRRLRRLPVRGRREVGGHAVTVVRDRRPLAFCAGVLRPRVYVSDAALDRLGDAGLRAVVEHEAHHARRRDPLRLLLAQTAADAFGFLPPLRGLARSQAALADLAADAAAVAAARSAAPLATALLTLEDPAPERVDQLLGRPLAAVSRAALAGAALALCALAVVAVCHVVLPGDPGVPAAVLPLLAAPALLARRAVGYGAQPSTRT
jgi:Zn-dependent protease with chaperone function